MPELAPEKVERNEAFAALDKILASEEFTSSPQLSAFLTFSVQQTLNGQGPALKAYTIATEVLSRPANFDPQNDPIVRVEATRLRRAIDRYYANDGAKDGLRITMPRGGYSVSFIESSNDPSPASTPRAYQPTREKRPFNVKAPIIIVVLLIASTAAATIGWKNWSTIFPESSSTGSLNTNNGGTVTRPPSNTTKPNNAPKPANWKPRIAAFSITSDSYANNLMHEIGDVLSRFDGIMVFDETAMTDQAADDLYQLDGRLKPGVTDRVDIRLFHTASHRTVVVRTATLPKDEISLQELAKKLAIFIGGRDGIVLSDALPAQMDGISQPINPRTCLSVSNAAIKIKEPELMATARSCLDGLLKHATNSGMLYAISADLRRHEKQADLATAEKEAQLALALDPQNVRAMHVLSELIDAKNPGLALRLGDLAVELNPYDPVIAHSQADRLRAAGLIGRADRLENELIGVE